MKSYNVVFSYSVQVEAEDSDEAYDIACENYVSKEDFGVLVEELED
jgi:hypothetical protein